MKFPKFFPLLFVIVLMSSSFSKSRYQNYRIVVGFAYSDMECNGLTVQTASGYEYQTSTSASSGNIISEVRKKVALNNRIADEDVIISTGSKPYGVIISYSKKVSGWNCAKKVYSAGFGNTRAEAEADAANHNGTKVDSYVVIRTISI